MRRGGEAPISTLALRLPARAGGYEGEDSTIGDLPPSYARLNGPDWASPFLFTIELWPYSRPRTTDPLLETRNCLLKLAALVIFHTEHLILCMQHYIMYEQRSFPPGSALTLMTGPLE